jgi:hypothetical protein
MTSGQRSQIGPWGGIIPTGGGVAPVDNLDALFKLPQWDGEGNFDATTRTLIPFWARDIEKHIRELHIKVRKINCEAAAEHHRSNQSKERSSDPQFDSAFMQEIAEQIARLPEGIAVPDDINREGVTSDEILAYLARRLKEIEDELGEDEKS